MIRTLTNTILDALCLLIKTMPRSWNGNFAGRFFPAPVLVNTISAKKNIDILMKVETHNHPTAISPFSGAATGSGGEIRDEGATGIGSKTKSRIEWLHGI